MRCDDVLLALSLRADDETAPGASAKGRPGPTVGDVDAHVGACPDCGRFASDIRRIRSQLRVEIIDEVPDVAAAVVGTLRAEPTGQGQAGARGPTPPRRGTTPAAHHRRRPGRRATRVHRVPRLAAAAAVAALAGVVAGVSVVGLGTEPRSPAAADVPDLVMAAQHGIDAVESHFVLTQAGDGAEDGGERSFAGQLVYRAPESLSLTVRETTPDVPGNERADGELVVDGEADRWWQRTARACSAAAGRVRCPDEPQPWIRSVTGREPFSSAAPVPLELVSPVDSFALAAAPASLGTRTIAGHRAVGLVATAGQAAPLLQGLSSAVELRPVHPADTVELWLDDQHLVPLALVVRAPDARPPRAWPGPGGARDRTGEVVLTMTATEVRINGAVDDDALRAPAGADVETVDGGFRAAPPDDPTVAAAPVPDQLPSGFRAHRSGTVAAPGGPPVAVRSWSDGRAWLTVRATTAWPGGRLFGDLGADVRAVDLGPAGTGYANSDGRQIGLHGDRLDLVVSGSLPADQLAAVAADLGVLGLPVPGGWAEASTADLADATAAVPGLLSATALDGFGDPAIRVSGDPAGGSATVTQVFAGAGRRAVGLTQRPGDVLAPPTAGDEAGVTVRGRAGRYSHRNGELEWVEGGNTLSLRSDTLTLAELLIIAARLEPA